MNNNSIEWIFEKMFDRIVDITETPYLTFSSETWDNDSVIDHICSLTKLDHISVKNYLSDPSYRYRFCYQKTGDRLLASIMINDQVLFRDLVNTYQPNYFHLEQAVLHNRLDICKEMKIEPKADLLMIAASYGYTDIYFWLRGLNLTPNLSVYLKAVRGHVEIVKDIDKIIAPNHKVLETAFEHCDTEVVRYLSSNKIKPKLYHYVIYQRHTDLFPREWERDHYYSAILSGDLDIVRLAEQKLPNIHTDLFLDQSKTNKGKTNILMNEMTYRNGSNILFSHCINYATQSKSLDMVKYIHNLGYGITLSNIITAIRQSIPLILSYLLLNYHNIIPIYIIHYLSLDSFIQYKQEKIRLILPYVDLDQKLSLMMRKRERAHLQLISNSSVSSEIAFADRDYLLNYSSLFEQYDKREIARLYLLIIDNRKTDSSDKQLLTDLLYLFGNLSQIREYELNISPSIPIIMELISYRSLGKLCHLFKRDLLPSSQQLTAVVAMLSDTRITDLFKKNNNYEPKLLHILLSRDRDQIIDHITTIKTKEEVRAAARLDLDLVKMFEVCEEMREYMRSYALKKDLKELYQYLDEESDTVQDTCVE